jgi:hypothetical protein
LYVAPPPPPPPPVRGYSLPNRLPSLLLSSCFEEGSNRAGPRGGNIREVDVFSKARISRPLSMLRNNEEYSFSTNADGFLLLQHLDDDNDGA